MKEPDGKYGEEIRRALSAAAELVVPAGDGLELIRRRTARRPPALAWLIAYAGYLPRQLFTWVRVVASELAVMARGESGPLLRLRAALRRAPGHGRSPRVWLGPAFAVASAVLLIVAITFAVPGLRQRVTSQSADSRTSQGVGGGASGQANGSGYPQPGGGGSHPAGALISPGASSSKNSSRNLYQIPTSGASSSSSRCSSGSGSGGQSSPVSPTSNPSPTGTSAAPDSPAGAASADSVTAPHLLSVQCSPSASASPSSSPSPGPTTTSPSPTPDPTSSSPTATPTTTPPAPSTSGPPDASPAQTPVPTGS